MSIFLFLLYLLRLFQEIAIFNCIYLNQAYISNLIINLLICLRNIIIANDIFSNLKIIFYIEIDSC